jgi:hypothetical protein
MFLLSLATFKPVVAVLAHPGWTFGELEWGCGLFEESKAA